MVGSEAQSTFRDAEEEFNVIQVTQRTPLQLPYVEKPSGYSFFAYEIVPAPKRWAGKIATLCHTISTSVVVIFAVCKTSLNLYELLLKLYRQWRGRMSCS